MHLDAPSAGLSVPYPSPVSLAPSDTLHQSSDDESTCTSTMSSGADLHVDGIGVLSYQRAIDVARNTEGQLDLTVAAYLETALIDIWSRINMHAEYVMTRDEFAIFNFYRARFEGNEMAESAVRRFGHFYGPSFIFSSFCTPHEYLEIPLLSGKNMRPAISQSRKEGRHNPMQITSEKADAATETSSTPLISDGLEDRVPSRSRILLGLRGVLSLVLVTFPLLWLIIERPSLFTPTNISVRSAERHQVRSVARALLEDFQIYPPVLTVTPAGVLEITDGSSNASVAVLPSTEPTCQQTLVMYDFASSYGSPFVGQYTPPSCSFNRVTWNLTVTSSGRQYDRLGSVSFGDIELFRTSTAEPTQNGIEWTYLKDMTSFLSLFKQEQRIIFDLDNIVTDVYTGLYNVTLTAAFFTAEDSIEPADLIVPVSKRQGAAGQPSYFTVPNDVASNDIALPRNIRKAIFTVSATGQAEEEFWWSNALQSEIDTFPAAGQLYGYSPFREVQLFIDGNLAGVAWPFPIIFTGGVVPGLWRPIVGIDAFDLKEDEIDVTPWLPLLCDGNSHNFTIRISGLNDNGNGTATLSETTDSNWWVAGKIFVWLDTPGHVTTGQGPSAVAPAPDLQVSSHVSQLANGSNATLLYQVNARRSLSFESTINLSNGSQTAFWSQDLSFSNAGNFTDNGNVETNDQQTTGVELSSNGYARRFQYPLYAYSTQEQLGDNLTLTAIVRRGKDVQTVGHAVFPTGLESFSNAQALQPTYGSFQGAHLSTTQNGTAFYTANQTARSSYSYGTTEQDMTFSGIQLQQQSGTGSLWSSASAPVFPSIARSTELFHRHARAVNSSVVADSETLIDTDVAHYHGSSSSPDVNCQVALPSFPGRGNVQLSLASLPLQSTLD